jgi:glycosyl transferase family 87
MAALSRRAQLGFVAVFALYACIVIPLGVRKGDDIMAEITQAERLLTRQMINTTPPGQGTWWPPFGALVVAPFALLARWSLPLAKAAWGAVGILALAWSTWVAGRRWGWRPAFAALAVVIFPVHNNFHHLNVETMLLALLVAAAADLSDGREGRAGTWVGLATALKVFPGLVLPYFAWRRQWKALAIGVLVAAAATLLALLPYGPRGMLEALQNWIAVAGHSQNYQGGAVAALHMQKLGRLGYAIGGAPASILALHVLAVGLVVAIVARRPPADDAPLEIGSVVLLAVLLTPVAWLHTFSLGYLAWVAAAAYPPPFAGRARTAWLATLWVAGVYASTALSALPLPDSLRWLTFHDDTIGAFVGLSLLLVQRRARIRRPAAASSPAGSPHPA